MSEIQNKLKYLKRLIIMTTLSAREGHMPSAFSILDIVWVLYDRIMKINPIFPEDHDRDRFILSKGHGSLALYTVLAEKGFFPVDELSTFAKYDSRLAHVVARHVKAALPNTQILVGGHSCVSHTFGPRAFPEYDYMVISACKDNLFPGNFS